MSSKPKFLTDFVGPSRDSGDQVNYQHCPVCGDTRWKVYLNPTTGFWYCHAGSHNAGGAVDVGMSMIGAGYATLEKLANKPQPRHEWSEIDMPPWEHLSARALRYLEGRGISHYQALSLGIVEQAERMRLVVPFFDSMGQIVYWTARAYSTLEEGPKYLAAPGRHPLYALPTWRQYEEVILVEGVFDAISVNQATGRPTVALCGKSLPRYLEYDLLGLATERVVIMLDSDALDGALRIRNRLASKRQVRVVPLPDGMDPASLGADIGKYLDDGACSGYCG